MRFRIFAPILVVFLLAGSSTSRAERSEAAAEQGPLRRPVALQLSNDERHLYVANRDSGTISVLDLEAGEVVHEEPIGGRLSHLVRVPTSGLLLATDEAAHELVLIEANGAEVKVRQRLAVSPYPVSAVASQAGDRAYVASLWSRRLSIVKLPQTQQQLAQIEQVLDLEIAPREQLLADEDRRLIVADSFQGTLLVIDPLAVKVLHTLEFPAHNIRGLRIRQETGMLAIAHQMLNELAHTMLNDVHWGLLMSNDLRWLKLQRILEGTGNLYEGAHMHPLGEAGRATGDPSALEIAPNGRVVVTLGGVGEVAIGNEEDFRLRRTKVGKRPTALVVTSDSRLAYVANTFSDSISVVDLEAVETEREIPLGSMRELTLAEQGELLFYDASLSHDSWMSCHSCHTDGHSNGTLSDNLGDNSFGAPKRVLSLLGHAKDTAPFAWNGQIPTLEAQIRKSIKDTMQSDDTPREKQVNALAAYVKTLPLPPPVDEMRGTRDSAAVERGKELFARLGCVSCHAPPAYTTPDAYDVGLEDERGVREFNPPSLRGVGQRGPYFHDARAKSLEEVFRKYEHQLSQPLEDEPLRDLLAFLRSL